MDAYGRLSPLLEPPEGTPGAAGAAAPPLDGREDGSLRVGACGLVRADVVPSPEWPLALLDELLTPGRTVDAADELGAAAVPAVNGRLLLPAPPSPLPYR